MPPVRNIAAIKPVKTERTHEENQERAYIAASRRSDRSLEARIESARRASEIHKKRTGRALRVTEQDVINEEMYEEEEEDLTAQYRRLTAHLQTGSMDFNRRFQAYIQTQAGTRMALASYDPTFANGGFMQSYPNAQHFNHQYMQMLPPNMVAPQMGAHSTHIYRQSPYPMTSPHLHGQQNHQRSASVAGPQDLSGHSTAYPQPSISQSGQEEHRRMSLPAQMMHVSSPLSTPPIQPQMSRTSSNAHIKPDSPRDSSGLLQSETVMPADDTQSERQPKNQNHSNLFPTTSLTFPENTASQHMNTSPFSYSLPPESQMALGHSVEQNGFPAAMLMAGSEFFPQSNFYSYNPNPTSKSKLLQEPSLAMTGTSTPNGPLLDTTSDYVYMQSPLSTTIATSDGTTTPFTPVFSNLCLGSDTLYSDEIKSQAITKNNSSQDSPVGDWDSVFDFEHVVSEGN